LEGACWPQSSEIPILEKAVVVEKGNMADMMNVLERGCYFQPLASNFPVIDAALMVGNDVFGDLSSPLLEAPASTLSLFQEE
jgi:hypothetical protein